MSIIPGKHLSGWQLLPARKGTCEWCAVAHHPGAPHDATSMFYKYRFYNETGRWPDWRDAAAHCLSDVRERWMIALKNAGVDVDAGQVLPRGH